MWFGETRYSTLRKASTTSSTALEYLQFFHLACHHAPGTIRVFFWFRTITTANRRSLESNQGPSTASCRCGQDLDEAQVPNILWGGLPQGLVARWDEHEKVSKDSVLGSLYTLLLDQKLTL